MKGWWVVGFGGMRCLPALLPFFPLSPSHQGRKTREINDFLVWTARTHARFIKTPWVVEDDPLLSFWGGLSEWPLFRAKMAARRQENERKKENWGL